MSASPSPHLLPPASSRSIDDPAALPGLVARLRRCRWLALDTETSSLEPHDAELIGLALATGVRARPGTSPSGTGRRTGSSRLLPRCGTSRRSTDPAVAPLAELLRDPAVPKAGHNIKYDWQVLRRAGVELAGVAYDSMLASFVLDPGRRSHGIDTLSLEHLGRPMRSYADLTGRGKAQIPFAEVPVAERGLYCGTDSATVLALDDFFAPSIRDGAVAPARRDRAAAGRGPGGHGVAGHRDRPRPVYPDRRS